MIGCSSIQYRRYAEIIMVSTKSLNRAETEIAESVFIKERAVINSNNSSSKMVDFCNLRARYNMIDQVYRSLRTAHESARGDLIDYERESSLTLKSDFEELERVWEQLEFEASKLRIRIYVPKCFK